MNEKTIENIESIVEMYRRKKSAKEIGKMYGISEQDTRSFLRSLKKIGAISVEDAKQRGNTRSITRIKGTSDRNRQIVFDYENFVDMKKMEEKYGLLETSIKQILAKEGIQLNRRSYRNLKYPQNLIFDIFGRIDFEISEDTEIGLNYCLETLSKRERKVLAEYYEKENTFKGIAKIFSNSAERIRQIHAKALRKLRNPRRIKYIEFGYKKYTEMIEKEKEEIQRKIENKEPAELKIEELNLSVRGYNCMKRAGINIISDLKSREQLMGVRNLVRKTFDEILGKLKDVGYEVPYGED